MQASRASLDTLLAGHRTTAWSPEDILERIKFSSRDGKRKKLLNEIKECNNYLEKLMVRNRQVLSTTKRRRKRLADPLHQVRQCACMVHGALSQVWRCSCQTPHNAKLRLEKRDPNTVLSAENISFRILFSSESVQGIGQAALWHWQETEIQIPPKGQSPFSRRLFNYLFLGSLQPQPQNLVNPALPHHHLDHRILSTQHWQKSATSARPFRQLKPICIVWDSYWMRIRTCEVHTKLFESGIPHLPHEKSYPWMHFSLERSSLLYPYQPRGTMQTA